MRIECSRQNEEHEQRLQGSSERIKRKKKESLEGGDGDE